jgi:hypothetical protein
MRARHVLALLVTLAALGFARPAAAEVQLGLGADWIEGGTGEFNVTLGAETWLARHLTVGGRAGAAFFGDSNDVAVPIDFLLKVHVQRIYFEGLVGPWVMIDSGDLFRFHGAFGFGLESRNVTFGLEVGVLRDATMVGARLAFRL